ncbi:MAG: hypothetical protein AAF471_08230, partial [Myxococcota bacterium]
PVSTHRSSRVPYNSRRSQNPRRFHARPTRAYQNSRLTVAHYRAVLHCPRTPTRYHATVATTTMVDSNNNKKTKKRKKGSARQPLEVITIRHQATRLKPNKTTPTVAYRKLHKSC